MARLEDIPEPTRTGVANLPCPAFETEPFVTPSPRLERRVAIVSSAALIRRGDQPFPVGSGEFRVLDRDTPTSDILISHVSINFDRAGYQRDLNVVYPIDRLRDLAEEGVIGSVAKQHYTVMGSTDPVQMVESAEGIALAMRSEGANTAILAPV